VTPAAYKDQEPFSAADLAAKLRETLDHTGAAVDSRQVA
jgi:hypothetical protein